MTHILEDLTHKMEGQPPKKDVIWVLGIITLQGKNPHPFLESFLLRLPINPAGFRLWILRVG